MFMKVHVPEELSPSCVTTVLRIHGPGWQASALHLRTVKLSNKTKNGENKILHIAQEQRDRDLRLFVALCEKLESRECLNYANDICVQMHKVNT